MSSASGAGPNDASEKFECWAFLELMGHRKLAGFVRETEIAGGKFLRIDAPQSDGKSVTQFYPPGSVYCITPTTEAMVQAYAARNESAPIQPYELTFKEAMNEPYNAVDPEHDDPEDLS